MIHTEFSLTTTDGLKLFGQSWQPENETNAVINLIHGIGEHSTRYAGMAEYYTERGMAIYAIDYRGHGKSEGKRGHTPSYENLMQDIDLLLDYSEKDNNCQKRFLYGHSLGGNLVINYVLRRKPNLTGLIASSPWLILGFDPPKWQMKMANIVKNIFPALSQKTGFHKEDLSKNLKNIELYEKDDLVHDKITVKLFVDAYDAAQWALDNAKEMSVPFLLMHGDEDKMTSPEGSKEFASKSEKTQLKIWEGFYHEIHNEEGNEKVYNWVIDWVKNC